MKSLAAALAALGLLGGCHVVFPHTPPETASDGPARIDGPLAELGRRDLPAHELGSDAGCACAEGTADGCVDSRCACGKGAACTGGLSCEKGICVCSGCIGAQQKCVRFANQTPGQCGAGGALCAACQPAGPCNPGADCKNGQCLQKPSQPNAPCDDGKACTANDTCSTNGQCAGVSRDQPGSDYAACMTEAGVLDPCQATCSEPLKKCVNQKQPAYTPCLKGTASGKCWSGICCTTCITGGICHLTGNIAAACGTAGDPCGICDDGNPCTKEACFGGLCTSGGLEPPGTPCGSPFAPGKCLGSTCCTGCTVDGISCLPAGLPGQCGKGGEACLVCPGGQTCVDGGCE